MVRAEESPDQNEPPKGEGKPISSDWGVKLPSTPSCTSMKLLSDVDDNMLRLNK